ncbi:MAG: hypothetical protein ABIW38_15400 [Ferruginibacter sp.]
MKKILTFLFAGMMFLMVTASANAAQVILNSQTNYEINIDGRVYNNGVGSTTITDLYQGAHTINVYQVVSNGLFGIGKKRNLISTQQFNLGTSDMYIDVNQNGQVRINQNGYGNNTNRNRNGGYNNNGGYDNNNNAGPGNSDWGHEQGKKKGHYKNKKNKQHKHNGDNDDNDERNDRNNNQRRDNN